MDDLNSLPAGTDTFMGQFNPEGEGFDMDTAKKFGMGPSQEEGPNKGHFGSVVPTTPSQQQDFGLPEDSYMLLKGRGHPTFDKAMKAEAERGFMIKKFGNRYFSVPRK